ncbi:hypothetical protein ABZ154_29680 [Streptomyces sp. NPDC006261]
MEELDGIDLKSEEIAHVLRGAITAGSLGIEASLRAFEYIETPPGPALR